MGNRGGRREGAGRPRRDPQTSWHVGMLALGLRNDLKKMTPTVERTAELVGCRARTVWSCLKDLGRLLREEKDEYDFLMEAAHETARKEAISSLTAEHGPDKEFCAEEIKERMELLEEEQLYRDTWLHQNF
jgi:hypothetical protein